MENPGITKRERILLTAQRLFARFGLRKTSVEEIIRLAKTAKGTFYKYFPDKEALFLEVVEKESASLMTTIREAVAQAPTSREKMTAYLMTKVSTIAKLANFYQVTREKIDEYWPKIEGVREKYLVEERKIVRDILTGGIDKGELEVADLELTTHAIVMAMGGLESSWIMQTSPLKLEDSVDSLLNVLFKGILKK
jgi:AcrR family transcriptional regulator